MIIGVILGIFVHNNYSADAAKEFSGYIKMLATVFIRLVQMIISPLVFTTLVVGIAKLGDIKAVGRIGGKALGWFYGFVCFVAYWDVLGKPLAARNRIEPDRCGFGHGV
jgi:Na+/H+-dicarboxylate symporter